MPAGEVSHRLVGGAPGEPGGAYFEGRSVNPPILFKFTADLEQDRP